jgi:hypothetical protein
MQSIWTLKFYIYNQSPIYIKYVEMFKYSIPQYRLLVLYLVLFQIGNELKTTRKWKQ